MISPKGWQVQSDSPVKFIRSRGMRSLPHPVEGGDLGELTEYTNTSIDDIRILVFSWLLGALKPKGPFPILNILGGQGTGKSTMVRILRDLIDPSIAPLRSFPKSLRDLMIASKNSWVLAYDNVSEIPDWLCDAFCRLSTGVGFSTRKLYTDSDENIISAMRPIVLDGIDFIPGRGDYMDRSLTFRLPPISKNKRMTEEELWKKFELARPRILGALLDIASSALSNLPSVQLKSLPRLADFARWIVSSEKAFGLSPGTFLQIYENNRRVAVEDLLEMNQVASAIRNLSRRKKSWQGTATDLLKELEKHIDEMERKTPSWPKSAWALSSKLRRAENELLSVGIEIEHPREPKTGKRLITIRQNNN